MNVGLAFFVYKRPKHTERVIETIKKNGFDRVYVFQDGLKNECDINAWNEVKALVEDWANTSGGHIEFHISDVNKGLAASIIFGINYVLARNDAVIALEDDVILGDGYYNYAKGCFEKYYNTKKVMSICGACGSDKVFFDRKYMKRYKNSDVIFMPVGSSVAFGTWKDRWQLYRYGTEYAHSIVDNEMLCRKIRMNGGGFLVSLLHSVVKNPTSVDTWATFWAVMQVVNNGVTVVPIKALAQDIGRDGSGTNTKRKVTRFYTALNSRKIDVLLPESVDIFQDIYLCKRQNIIVQYGNPFIRNILLLLLKIRQRINL